MTKNDDYWGLGFIFHQLRTGYCPFVGTDVKSVFNEMGNEVQLSPLVPQIFRNHIEYMFSNEPDKSKNTNIVQSEVEGKLCLKEFSEKNRCYDFEITNYEKEIVITIDKSSNIYDFN